MTSELLISTTLDRIGSELNRAEQRLHRRKARRRVAVVALAAPFALGGSALAGVGPLASVLGTTPSQVPAPPPYHPGDKVWTTTPPDEAQSDVPPAAGSNSQAGNGGKLPLPVRPKNRPGDKVCRTTPPPS